MMFPFAAVIASLMTVVPMTPSTQGAWTTYLKPYRYSDLLVRGDTVWCATREAGLLSYRPSQQRFSAITRFPNGLASNELSALAYDRSGNLWIGTYGAGASRMSKDGSTWALVNAFDGLPSDTISTFAAEGDTMWIGTPRGLAFWNGTAIAGSLPIFGQPSPFGSDNITGVVAHPESLFVSTLSGIYVSTRSSGLQVWSPFNSGLFNFNIHALVTNDTLLFCISGIRVYAYVNGSWEQRPGIGDAVRLTAQNGTVIATTDQGIYRVCNGGFATINTELASNATDDRFSFAVAPLGGNLYVAADQDGLYEQLDPAAASGWPLMTPDTPPDNDIRNLAIDGGRVWVNSSSHGVGRFEGTSWRIWPNLPLFPPGLSSDTTFSNPLNAWALLVDKGGQKWFGFWEYSVDQFDDSDPALPPHVVHHIIDTDALGAPAHTRAWASAADGSGGRWFGMDTPSLGAIDPIGIEYYLPNGDYGGNLRTSNSAMHGNKVHALTVDKRGYLWFGLTGQGIGRFRTPIPGDANFPFPPTGMEYVTGSDRLDVQGLVARGDTLWALTTHELQRYVITSVNNLPLATYTIPEATPLFAANPLAVGPDGSPWVGTEAGIRVFHANNTFEDFNTRTAPVAGDQIYAIRVDPNTGVAWIATSTGINRYDPSYRPPPPPQVQALLVRAYPNPSVLNRGGIQLKLIGNSGAYEGTIFDIGGRKVHRFEGAANKSVIWNGTDDGGRQVKPGVYFVHVEAGGQTAMVRIAVLR